MDKVINLGVPHIGELIFEQLSTQTLIKNCYHVSHIWRIYAEKVLFARLKRNIRDKKINRTVLKIACIEGNEEVIKMILQYYARKQNLYHDTEWTALMYACYLGYADVVKSLLIGNKKGTKIDINAKTQLGETAVSLAFRKTHLRVIKPAVRKGGPSGPKSNLVVIKLLLQHEKTPREENVFKRHIAEAIRSVGIKGVEKLWKYFALNNWNSNLIKLLLLYNLVPPEMMNERDHTGLTPFLRACTQRDQELINLMLQNFGLHSDVVNAKDINENTGLMLACIYGQLETVKLLLKYSKIKTNTQDKYGNTAFISACKLGNADVVKCLLNFPYNQHDTELLNPNIKDNYDNTGLMWACREGFSDLVQIFLNHENIDFNTTNNEGLTGLMLACIYGHLDTVKLLIKHSKSKKIDIQVMPLRLLQHFSKIKKIDIQINEAKEITELLIEHRKKDKSSVEKPGNHEHSAKKSKTD